MTDHPELAPDRRVRKGIRYAYHPTNWTKRDDSVAEHPAQLVPHCKPTLGAEYIRAVGHPCDRWTVSGYIEDVVLLRCGKRTASASLDTFEQHWTLCDQGTVP